MPPLRTLDFVALLLAGGKSTRMGQDKALLKWKGIDLWEFQAKKLKSLQPSRLMISARREQGLHLDSEARVPEAEWVFDPPSDDLGPMGAIYRVMMAVSLPVLVLAVDMPFMTVAFLRKVCAEMESGQGIFFESISGLEPLAGCYPPAMQAIFQSHIEARRLSLQSMVRAAAGQDLATIFPLKTASAKLFENINTPELWGKKKPG